LGLAASGLAASGLLLLLTGTRHQNGDQSGQQQTAK
jgi:hypothetical protein